MGRLNRRADYERKLRAARAFITDPRLDDNTKSLALALLNFTNKDGVIVNADVNAMIHEALSNDEEQKEEAAHGDIRQR